MDELGVKDDKDAGVDVCGVTDDVTEEAQLDAKMFGLLPGLGKQNQKGSTLPTVSQDQDDYDMTHIYRGYALLLNNEKFNRKMKEMGLSDRAGTDVDEANMRRQLEDLGFRVRSITDRSVQQMKTACYEMATKDHNRCDCFVCVVLSHGDEGVVYGTDNAIEIKELTRPFKGDMCPTLMGKPKIFIIQACRGCQTDPGVSVDVVDAKGKAPTDMDVEEEPNTIKLPIEADFLFAYSTVPGYYSWRNGRNGSCFIQALCQTLKEHGNKMEFKKILTLVNKKVAQKFQSNTPDDDNSHRMKQIPCITTMLTKDLYFNIRKERKLP